MNRMPPKIPRPTPAPRVESPWVKSLLEQVESGKMTQETLVAELKQQMLRGTPLKEHVEESELTISTFFYENEQASQVLIFINRITDETHLERSIMEEILDTGIFTISFWAEPDWRASYCFIPAYSGEQPLWLGENDQVQLRYALDRGQADPTNPNSCLNRAGNVMSVVQQDDAPAQPYNLSLEELKQVSACEWDTLADGRKISLVAVGTPESTSPVVFILDGEVWAAMGLHASAQLAYSNEALPACYLVMVDSGGRETRWAELDGSAPYSDHLEQVLIPWLREQGVEVSAERTYIAGQSLGGLTSLLSVFERPDLFAGAIAQSSSLWQPIVADTLKRRLAEGSCDELSRLRLMVEVGQQEWVLVPPHRELTELLNQANITYSFTEYNGGHDYACWRGSLIDNLISLLTSEPKN